MCVLTAAELKDDLKFVTLLEEFLGMAKLGLVIMGTDLYTKLDLLDLGCAVLALLLLFGELVLKLAEIGDAADGRIGSRRHLDQVEAVGLGPAYGLVCVQDAELLACGANDDAHFAGANAVVDADECGINGTSICPRLVGARGCGGMKMPPVY